MRLSVLDQSPIRKGGTAADAVRETLELAGPHLDQLGERPLRRRRALGKRRSCGAEQHEPDHEGKREPSSVSARY